jgi:hypothetical protein
METDFIQGNNKYPPTTTETRTLLDDLRGDFCNRLNARRTGDGVTFTKDDKTTTADKSTSECYSSLLNIYGDKFYEIRLGC